MDWSDFIFWWLEWPLKITIAIILTVTLTLFWNNVFTLIFRGIYVCYSPEDDQYYTDAIQSGKRWSRFARAMNHQLEQKGALRGLFVWHGWFWSEEHKQ